MMETRTLTCIGCPLGCTLKAELEGNTVRSVTGNTCPNGEKYARKELTAHLKSVVYGNSVG